LFLESSLGPTDTEGCRDNHHHPGSPRRQSLAKLRSAAVALIGFAEHDPVTQRRVAAFLKRLADLGWTLDRNVAIDFRYGAVDADKNRAFAKELVSLNPDVIFVNSTSATAAVQRETTIIPVVFATVSDPVGSGFAASLARPGGNITGFVNVEASIAGKWLGLLTSEFGTSRKGRSAPAKSDLWAYPDVPRTSPYHSFPINQGLGSK
jgi:hypothetical protein